MPDRAELTAAAASNAGVSSNGADEAGTAEEPGRDLPHRLLLSGLAILLLAISLWCFLLLFRSFALRQDLDLHQGWIDQMRGVRAELEQPAAEIASRSHWPLLESLQRESELVFADHHDPDLRLAAHRLSSSLEQFHGALLLRASSTEPALSEKVWDASFAVLKATSSLEEQVQKQMDGIYARLNRHWRGLNALVVVCLVLCASNLGLLHLAHRRRKLLEQARDRALELASHDALTGLWNREAILKMLRREMSRSKRLQVSMGLILADVDEFRQINGLIGQDQADIVLQEIGWRLGSLVRPYDTLGRFSGDAFLVLLPTCDSSATANVARRLGQALDKHEVEYGVGRIEVSLSMVYATIDRPDETDPDLLVHRLQEALIEARQKNPKGAVVGLDRTTALATAVETRSPET